MTPAARKVTEDWLVLCEQNGRKTEGAALVFPHPRTRSYLPAANLTRRLYNAMRKAGILDEGECGRKRNLHSLRFARITLESGNASIDWVSRQLGHSTIVLTVGTYGHWSREAERKQAKRWKEHSMSEDVIEAIREQLFRLRARREDVQYDAILPRDLGNGGVYLHATSRGRSFDCTGPALEALKRLRGLPDDRGQRRSDRNSRVEPSDASVRLSKPSEAEKCGLVVTQFLRTTGG